MPEISVMVEGGKATAGAPLGPALGPLGINIGKVVAEINEKTRCYEGMKIPVKIKVDTSTKNFEIIVGTPTTSALIKKEAKLDKLTDNPKSKIVGNITFEQLVKIAKMKMGSLGSYNLKAAVKEIAGSCSSCGVSIDGMHAKEFQKKLAAGVYDSRLKE